MAETPDIHQSKDGSSTLYSNQFNQFYHNPNGAVSESLHVFFETSGLNRALTTTESITIVEVGFGTGLNLLLLMDAYKTAACTIPVQYYSIEAFPIDSTQARRLQFSDHLNHPSLSSALPPIFEQLSPGLNSIKAVEDLNIDLHLFYGALKDFDEESLNADFIFQDAFSPDVNAELWTVETFEKLFRLAKPSAILTTYCAASGARAAMATAGWHVARAPGALGKREMSIASPLPGKLSNYKRVNGERLIQRLKNGDFNSDT
ncbi:MAG: tRNA (5-methylaminomethyl-2-thiouridine)(34)-methyltransferase MnmD [Balneolaceae bacterium]|nr:tRNA (5-methylaminomethyl-2-thiouridine)(34)-methyltransferase MnmD [Balneolaceae bacterium]